MSVRDFLTTADKDAMRAKLPAARRELRHALDSRARLAGALADEDGMTGWDRDRLTVELHVADVRVDLFRQLVAGFVEALGLRS